MTFRFGALDSRHRHRLAEILAATEVFSRDEVEVALELFDETLGGGRQEVGGRRLQEAAPTSPLAPPTSGYEFLGLFDASDTLVGYVCYGPTPGTHGTYDLYWIALDPAAQGGGEGSRLLAEVERRLRARGGRLLIVETSSATAYARTRRFYESRAYREAARVNDFYGLADDRVIYAKRLVPHDAPAASQSPSPY
jgi:ribosomal protein S18 acetylase RimI-like enzyme